MRTGDGVEEALGRYTCALIVRLFSRDGIWRILSGFGDTGPGWSRRRALTMALRPMYVNVDMTARINQ
jgi:hypothetical protein